MYKLGQEVTFSQRSVRKVQLDDNQEVERMAVDIEEQTGILTGVRHMPTGFVTEESEDDGWYLGPTSTYKVFHRTGTVKVALVTTNLYRNPEVVPFENLR